MLERLEAGEVIIGDGSYVFTLEKRGYVQAGDSLENCLNGNGHGEVMFSVIMRR